MIAKMEKQDKFLYLYFGISISLMIYATYESYSNHSSIIYVDLFWLFVNVIFLTTLHLELRKKSIESNKKTYCATLDSKVIGQYDGVKIYDKLLCFALTALLFISMALMKRLRILNIR